MHIANETAFATGDVIGGRYVLCEQIGIGGMGIVFAALQPALERTVAIKLPRAENCRNPFARRRFEAEAIACSRLSHPNIVSVFDFGHTGDGIPFLAMQRLRGTGLGQLVAEGGPFSLARAVGIIEQVLAALVEAHELGMVHSDVKSDNVLVESDGGGGEHATLIDFGLVRISDRPAEYRDEICGTPDYIAPEIVLGHAPTNRSDIYSVGCVLYELVTGSTPFGGGPAHGVMARHLEDEVVPPSARCPGLVISRAFEELILRAMAKQPSDRFRTAAELAAALAAVAPRDNEGANDNVIVEPTPKFSSSAKTLDLIGREQTTTRIGKQRDDEIALARTAVGDAIAVGDIDRIVVAYLELAHALVGRRRMGAALEELGEAIDVVTCGEGVSPHAPAPLWRLLVSMAAIQAGLGDPLRARRLALEALAHATYAKSRIGRSRARRLLAYLERYRVAELGGSTQRTIASSSMSTSTGFER